MNPSHSSSHAGYVPLRPVARWLVLVWRCSMQLVALPITWGVRWAPLALVIVASALLIGWPKAAPAKTAIFIAVLFGGCVALHLLEALTAVHWREKGCPIVLPHSTGHMLLAGPTTGMPLVRTTGACAAVLCGAWACGLSRWSLSGETLAYGIIDAAMSFGMAAYSRVRPDFLLRAPTARPELAPLAPVVSAATVPEPVTAAPSQRATPAGSQQDYATPVTARKATISFSGIFGMQTVKDKLLEPAQAIVCGVRPAGEPTRNGILLHGKPGNGKTLFAEALAGELKVPIISLTFGDVSSKWLGEMPRVLSNCFSYAKANAPCVLFIDEIDSFVRSREFASGNSEDVKITNTLLTQIVAVRDHRVVLVGATNYLANLDGAAVREGRFDFKVEITPPDEAARIGILRAAASRYGAGLDFDSDAILYVARRWQGYSVSRITAVAKALPAFARSQGTRRIGASEWTGCLREVQGRSNCVPAGAKRLHDLVLDAATARALSLVAQRLKDSYRIESLGGTLPRGILVHGAPGMGKTTAARALAIECGWAFIATSGAQLVADRSMFERLFADAAERRPAILLIDDADDIIAARQFGPAPDLLARMQALLDGGDELAMDVVVIVVGSDIAAVEPALLRAGRLEEHIELTAPAPSDVARLVRKWVAEKQVRLHPRFELRDLVHALEDRSFADIEGILQWALNRAIQRTALGTRVTLAPEDVRAAPMLRSVSASGSRRLGFAP